MITSREQKLDNKLVIPLPHYSIFTLPNGKMLKPLQSAAYTSINQKLKAQFHIYT